MTAKSKTIKTYTRTPLYVVENHDEVVPYIHRAIGSRHLPLTDIVFVHFDSHPDMLIPKDMPADAVYDKDVLYDTISIENWIIPMVYAGHITDLLWVKPPWCQQIQDKTIQFYVGKCIDTGTIRTNCRENYFVSEVLFCPEDQLTDKKLVTLTVLTIEPTGWCDILSGSLNANHSFERVKCNSPEIAGSSRDTMKIGYLSEKQDHSLIYQCHADDEKSCKTRSGSWQQSLSSLDGKNKEAGYCVQDLVNGDGPECKKSRRTVENLESEMENSKCTFEIAGSQSHAKVFYADDSDILSTKFISKIDKIFDTLKDRYIILDIDLDFFSTKNPFKEMYTNEQYDILKELYHYSLPEDLTDKGIKQCLDNREKQLKGLKHELQKFKDQENPAINHEKKNSIQKLVQNLKSSCSKTTDVDYDLLHEAGCTCDDTELPHHVSTQDQISRLVEATQEFLCHMKKATIVTMARSSIDDYCPPNQVNSIQEQVLEMLQDLYLELEIIYDYEDTTDDS